MDQRTRERLPALEPFATAAAAAAADHHQRRLAALNALLAVPPGAAFTVHNTVLTRTQNAAGAAARDPGGVLLHFDIAEHRAFWAWAAVEVLRHTGARIEEMLELSHYAMIQYRLPTTGEIVPQLQIAPSKTDQERVLLVSPELADILATRSTPPRPSRPTEPSSPADEPCDRPRSTAPPPMPNGRTFSVTSNAANSRSPGQPGWRRGEAPSARSGPRAAYGRGPWHSYYAW
ncbi:hypothetical protein [Streptomyces sp. NPDC060366]|uniref:hypothetical protein n=1 Tax=Streptomyces sp. NPDC060366 TaxID=3347105 RepID=UPI00366850C9